MSVDSGNTNGTVFFVIELWTTKPAAKKTRQFVAGDVFVIGMHAPDSGEALVVSHAVEEAVYEGEDSILAAGRPKGRIANTVLLP